jgi:hypothetical protein
VKKIPPSWYGPNRDGLLDPDRLTAAQRARQSPAWLGETRDRRASASPLVRRLQAATDRALGRR